MAGKIMKNGRSHREFRNLEARPGIGIKAKLARH